MESTLKSHVLFHALCMLMLLVCGQSAHAYEALIVHQEGYPFEKVANGLTNDLKGEITFKKMVVRKTMKSDHISEKIKEYRPDVLVLIGYQSIALYKAHQLKNPSMKHPPAVALAAPYMDNVLKDVKNVTGIRYEIPIATSMIGLRALLPSGVSKVGVIHRSWMREKIAKNSILCKNESIELVSIELPDGSSNLQHDIKYSLEKLKSDNIDALWIVSDSGILNGKSIRQSWMPKIQKMNIPVVVGVDALVSNVPLGSLSATADPYGLGVQAAAIIDEILDAGLELKNTDIVQPLHMNTLVNVDTLNRKGIRVNKNRLRTFNTVINNE
ncbi:hypothetical protein OAV62_01390 [bacterium]|nr:hypothetical protein [bacterium]